MNLQTLDTLAANNDVDVLINAIKAMIQSKYSHWSQEDLHYLEANFRKQSYAKIAETLGRTEMSIKKKVEKLQMRKNSPRTVKIVRPPSIYNNPNTREELLNKYAPL